LLAEDGEQGYAETFISLKFGEEDLRAQQFSLVGGDSQRSLIKESKY